MQPSDGSNWKSDHKDKQSDGWFSWLLPSSLTSPSSAVVNPIQSRSEDAKMSSIMSASTASHSTMATEDCSTDEALECASERTSLLVDRKQAGHHHQSSARYSSVESGISSPPSCDLYRYGAAASDTDMHSPASSNNTYAHTHAHTDHQVPMQSSLNQLEVALSKIVDKPAYEQALACCYEHVKNPNVRKMFLDAADNNPTAAARNIASFYAIKRELFGPQKIGHRKLHLRDLSGQDLAELTTGHVQLLSNAVDVSRKRLQNRRPIVLCCLKRLRVLDFMRSTYSISYPTAVTDAMESPDTTRMLRNLWYTCFAAVEDTCGANVGAIIIPYGVGMEFQFAGPQLDLLRRLIKMGQAMPFPVEMLFCFDDAKFRPLLEMIKTGMSQYQQSLLKVHIGSHTECQYALLTCGISPNSIPVTEEGNLDRSHHLEWLRRQKASEGFMGEMTCW